MSTASLTTGEAAGALVSPSKLAEAASGSTTPLAGDGGKGVASGATSGSTSPRAASDKPQSRKGSSKGPSTSSSLAEARVDASPRLPTLREHTSFVLRMATDTDTDSSDGEDLASPTAMLPRTRGDSVATQQGGGGVASVQTSSIDSESRVRNAQSPYVSASFPAESIVVPIPVLADVSSLGAASRQSQDGTGP
jgi:hypothetical protein